jgi:hypothetical protein
MHDNGNKEAAPKSRLRWGSESIGQFINRSRRQTDYLLASGRIRSAVKRGRLWVAHEDDLEQEFRGQR